MKRPFGSNVCWLTPSVCTQCDCVCVIGCVCVCTLYMPFLYCNLQDLYLDVGAQKRWSYKVKVINPHGMGGYELHPLDSHEMFSHVQDLKESILTGCQEYIEGDKQLHFGYILPGHGKKGKQIELTSDDELCGMYPRYKGTEIVLWMKHTVISTTRKRSRTPAESQESDSNALAHHLSPKVVHLMVTKLVCQIMISTLKK